MNISVDEVARRFEQGETLVLLDVRQPHERDYCRIAVPPGASDLFIPMAEIPERLAEVQSASALAATIVYCHHGVRSRMVAEWLRAQGVTNVFNLAGGIDVWSRRIDPDVPQY